MKSRCRVACCFLVSAFLALTIACEASSSILSDGERNSLYTVAISLSDKSRLPLVDGSYLVPGQRLDISLSKISGVEEPAFLELGLEGQNSTASLTMVSETATAKGRRDSIISVKKLDGLLPSFEIPKDLPAGVYRLALSLTSMGGKRLHGLVRTVFIGLPKPQIASVSFFPPSIEAGSPVLLAAQLDQAEKTETQTGRGDPWIRWSSEGRVFASGRLSEDGDKAVWTAPQNAGAYVISVEVFPVAPTDKENYAFRSPSAQEFKPVVAARQEPGTSYDDFAESSLFLSLFRLDGSIKDEGSESRQTKAQIIGKPRLDIYPGGFGYRFGPEAGLSIAGLMPPSSASKPLPFTLVARIAPAADKGRFFRFVSEDGSYILDFGIDKNLPYVELLAAGKLSRSLVYAPVSGAPQTIAVSVQPGEQETGITWFCEGTRIAAPALPKMPDVPQGRAIVGGEGCLAGVYDAFGLAGARLPSLYRNAAKRYWGSSLVLAEGFENRVLPAGMRLVGAASFGMDGLRLAPLSSLSFTTPLRFDRPLLCEAQLAGDAAAALFTIYAASGEPLALIRGDGSVLAPDKVRRGALSVADGKLAFVVAPLAGGIGLEDAESFFSPKKDEKKKVDQASGKDQDLVFSIKAGESAGRIGLDRVEEALAFDLSRILLRTVPAALGSKK